MPLVNFPFLIYLVKETAFNLRSSLGCILLEEIGPIDLGSEIYHYPQKMDNEM